MAIRRGMHPVSLSDFQLCQFVLSPRRAQKRSENGHFLPSDK